MMEVMLRIGNLSRAAGLIAGLGLVGCDTSPAVEGPPEAPGEPGAAVDYLSAAVAASLTAEGRIPNLHQYPTNSSISPKHAVALATAAIRQFGPHFAQTLEREAGGAALDFETLVPDGIPLVANTPYAPTAHGAAIHVRNLYASHYIVNFGHGGRPLVSVSVSTEAWDVELTQDGKVQFPLDHGNEFRIIGIHPDGRWGSPMTAEEAVLATARVIPDMKIIETPVLVGPAADWLPHYANWRIRLGQPVSAITADGRVLDTDVVYIGRDGGLRVPASESPPRRRTDAPDRLSDLRADLVGIALTK